MRKTKKQHRKRQTKTKLASKIGVSRSTLHSWQQQGCPVDKTEADILTWAMENTRRGHEPSDIRAAKLSVLLQTARRLQLANDAKQDLTISKTDVSGVMAKGLSMLFNSLDRIFVGELPASAAGLDPAGIAKVSQEHISKLQNELRAQWSAMIEGKPA